jgi:hypothetical protein
LQVRAAEEARSFWRTYDMDGSGTLDSHELLAMLIDLGFEDCTPERVEKEMRLMDTQVVFCALSSSFIGQIHLHVRSALEMDFCFWRGGAF